MSSKTHTIPSSGQKVYKKDGVWTVDGRPRETRTLLSQYTSSTLPNKVCITLLLTLPPNAATPPHMHAGATVTAFVHTGAMLNQMNSDEAFVSRAGETFVELPGCRHVRGENASVDEEATVFVHFVVDETVVEEKGLGGLVVLDADVDGDGDEDGEDWK